MRSDGEAVGLVAQALNEIEHRIALGQHEGLSAGNEEFLPPGIPVRSLGNADQRNVGDPEAFKRFTCGGQLPLAAVDQHQVGPGGHFHHGRIRQAVAVFVLLRGNRIGFDFRCGQCTFVFLQKPGEPARQDFAHHAVVVPGDQVFRLDVELAVMGLRKAFGTRDDHAADRIGAHDVRVVVDLDPPWREGQVEGFGHALQQARLAGGFRKAASERFAGVGQRVVDQVLLFAALWNRHLDLPVHTFAQRFGEKGTFGKIMGEQDLPGGRFVVVELGKETFQDRSLFQRFVGLGEIGPVAPVLAGPEEEHLHAGLPAFLMDGEDVRLLHVVGIDALMGLDVRQGGQSVPVDRGALEVERFGGLFHLLGQFLFHQLAAAGKEGLGFGNKTRIVFWRDFAGAGACAALDLVEQAGTCAVLVVAVGAVPDQKGFLQRIDRAVHRAGGGEGAEIVAFALAGAAMLDDCRRFVIAGDQNIGKRLVVAQKHVETRAQPLDQVGFQKQRFGFRPGDHEFHGRRGQDHAHDPVRLSLEPGIAGDPFLQASGLADVKHVAVLVDHAIDAGAHGQTFDDIGDHLDALARRLRLPAVLFRRICFRLGRELCVILHGAYVRRLAGSEKPSAIPCCHILTGLIRRRRLRRRFPKPNAVRRRLRSSAR